MCVCGGGGDGGGCVWVLGCLGVGSGQILLGCGCRTDVVPFVKFPCVQNKKLGLSKVCAMHMHCGRVSNCICGAA